jgi:hypothetical protein
MQYSAGQCGPMLARAYGRQWRTRQTNAGQGTWKTIEDKTDQCWPEHMDDSGGQCREMLNRERTIQCRTMWTNAGQRTWKTVEDNAEQC